MQVKWKIEKFLDTEIIDLRMSVVFVEDTVVVLTTCSDDPSR